METFVKHAAIFRVKPCGRQSLTWSAPPGTTITKQAVLLRDLNVIIFVCFSYLTSKILWLRKYHHCTAQSWTGTTNHKSPPPFSNATSHALFSHHPSDAQGPGFLLIKAKQTTYRKTCLERHQPPAQQCEFCGLCINIKSVFYTLIPESSSSHNFKEIKSMLITTKPVFYISGLKLDMA